MGLGQKTATGCPLADSPNAYKANGNPFLPPLLDSQHLESSLRSSRTILCSFQIQQETGGDLFWKRGPQPALVLCCPQALWWALYDMNLRGRPRETDFLGCIWTEIKEEGA